MTPTDEIPAGEKPAGEPPTAKPPTGESSGPDYSGPPTRPADLPLLYILLALQLMLLLIVPCGGWILAPLVRRLVDAGRFPAMAPWLFLGVGLLVEVAFLWRIRRLFRRIRSVRPAPRPPSR